MASVVMGDAEKTFILEGIKENVRVDGRHRKDVRPIILETDIITHANGSARIRLANTDVLVGVKADLTKDQPGGLAFYVDCSANASPEFEGRGGEDLATEISSTLATAYSDLRVFDTSILQVLKTRYSWVLCVDVLILEVGGGNLFDVSSAAVKSALFATKVPTVRILEMDGGVPEIELSDDPDDGFRCDVSNAPVLVTLNRIGHFCIVDASPNEEACSSAAVVVAVTPIGKISSIRKIGSGSFHPDTLEDALSTAKDVGINMNKALYDKLKEEEQLGSKRKEFGFLRE
ncbi:exosome complex component RRP42 [Lepeophtheirus salmonis]|uniref:exosome complex component RRP42 n=1 Tax=Lepeophtheirus salmonis TaxID=72036 RepID=UPI001AE7C925|nr:exosome complex component RRP42-like [Lepeophtheirus salmonis]XP_040574549.1 exosome complex component RRP42-like [Lepeophtheirus salmonis]